MANQNNNKPTVSTSAAKSVAKILADSTIIPQDDDIILSGEDDVSPASFLLEHREYNRVMDRFEQSSNPDSDPIIDEITYEFRKNRTLVRSSGVLNIVQRRVLNILIWNAFNNIESGKMSSIPIEVFEELMANADEGAEATTTRQSQYANRKYWLTVAASLRKTEILLFTDDANRRDDMVSTGLVSDLYYNSEKGILVYAFNKITAGLIRDAAFSAQLDVRLISEISSKYSLALLEICASYLMDGHTPWWPVDIWRRDLGIQESETSYQEFRYFNVKVLKPSMEDVERLGNMRLTMEKRTLVGRKVSAFRFLIERIESSDAGVATALEIKKSPVFIGLTDFGVSPALVSDGILHSMEMCSAILTACKEGFADGTIKSPGGWCANMIRTRTTPVTKAKLALIKSEESKKSAPPKSKASKIVLQRDEMEKKANSTARAFNRRLVDEYINKLAPREVVEHARYFLHKNSFVGNRELFVEATKNALEVDGSIVPEPFNYIIKSSLFRAYLASVADPGGDMLRAEILDKLGEAGLEFVKVLIGGS